MKVALVHDWLTGMRGGERVLEELCALFPDATVFTLLHEPGTVSRRIESMAIQATFLNRLPAVRRAYRYAMPLFPWAMSTLNLDGFEVIISSSHAVAKGIRKPPGSLHICYCHTPMRYVWGMQRDYFHYGDPLWIKRAAVWALTQPLRLWDRATACGVDHFIAASRNVQERILRCYGRQADLIYPPVDTEFFTPARNGSHAGFFLLVSALVPYKRIDIAIEAFNCMGHPLVVVGSGPDFARLKRRASGNIRFEGFVSNDRLRDLYHQCRAVVITAHEDFGLVSLEAQACGRPPLAYAAGGSLESIVDGHTGILYERQSVAGLMEAVRRFEGLRLDPAELRFNSERFSRGGFRRTVLEYIVEKKAARRVSSTVVQQPPLPVEPCPPRDVLAGAMHPSLSGVAGIAKRCVDVVLSSCGLMLLGLPMALLACLIRRESAGPALFFQTRVGLRGRSFVMIKLRTMYLDAELQSGPAWAANNDPRCTRLGGFLRRYGIDELPQLWNVLMGDMSLIGPRPERPEFQADFEANHPHFRRRLAVRGGISGLAQIRGWRGDTPIEGRLDSDLEYVRRWSFWMDLLILLRTPLFLFRQREHMTRHTRLLTQAVLTHVKIDTPVPEHRPPTTCPRSSAVAPG